MVSMQNRVLSRSIHSDWKKDNSLPPDQCFQSFVLEAHGARWPMLNSWEQDLNSKLEALSDCFPYLSWFWHLESLSAYSCCLISEFTALRLRIQNIPWSLARPSYRKQWVDSISWWLNTAKASNCWAWSSPSFNDGRCSVQDLPNHSSGSWKM